MSKTIPFLLVAVLTACGQSETPKQADVPTVEELAADPALLKELRQQCKTDRARLGRCAVQPSRRGYAKAVLWQGRYAQYNVERVASCPLYLTDR